MTSDLVPAGNQPAALSMAELLAEAEKPLTAKQRDFARLYLGECRNNAQAACKIAGYSDPKSGWRLLQQANIQAYLRLLVQTLDFDREQAPSVLFDEMLNLATFDPITLCDTTGDGKLFVRKLDELPRHARICIKSMKEVSIRMDDGKFERVQQIEFYDRIRAAELAGRWIGMERKDGGILDDSDPVPQWTGINVILGDGGIDDAGNTLAAVRALQYIEGSEEAIDIEATPTERSEGDGLEPNTPVGPVESTGETNMDGK